MSGRRLRRLAVIWALAASLITACSGETVEPADASGMGFARSCAGTQPAVHGETRYDIPALECAISQLFDGREWHELSREDKTIATDFLGRLYIATGDDSLQRYGFCSVYMEDIAEIAVRLMAFTPEADIPAGQTSETILPTLLAFYECETGHAEPPVIEDPEYERLQALLSQWDGTCSGEEHHRAAINAGIRLYDVDAMLCAYRLGLSGRTWNELPSVRRQSLQPVVLGLTGLQQPGPWDEIRFCGEDDWEARIDNHSAVEWLRDQATIRGQMPPDIDRDAQDWLFICEEP